MIVLQRKYNLPICNICKLVRFSTTDNDFTSKFKFTLEQQEKILNTLNNSNADQLSRFDVTQTRIKHLVKWKSKEGPFKSLTDVLEVDGLSIKILERLCESIVTETPINKTNATPKPRRQYLIPALCNNLVSAVGFHLGSNGISWAKLCVEKNCLENWNYIDFSANPKKMLPLDTFKLAMRILNEIPTGDAYIFEGTANMSPQNNKQSSIITSYTQQLELTSMLFALINTSNKHNLNMDEDTCVYHLKSNLSARLFKTLVGSERVSSTTSVSNILQNRTDDLPCSSVIVDKELQQQYFLQSAVIRELLGQSLLLIVAFMDICVYSNPKSLEAVMPGRH